jgi:hypothetical protein
LATVRLPETIERGLEAIAADGEHGAAELYARVLELAGGLPPDRLAQFGRRLLVARRDMAPLVNLALALEGSPDPEGELRRRVAVSKLAPGWIVSEARAIIGSGRRVVTVSRSSTALAVLAALKPALVLCLESLPGGEGRRAAADLKTGGVRVELVPDDGLKGAVRRVELGLCGADVVTERAVVNKVGTLRLAEGLSALGRPLYVVADRAKFLPADYYEPPEPGGPFEEVPRSLVERVIDGSDDDREIVR